MLMCRTAFLMSASLSQYARAFFLPRLTFRLQVLIGKLAKEFSSWQWHRAWPPLPGG